MAKHFSNVSSLGLNREGLTKKAVKAHMAQLQQQLRDIHEEMRQLTGGGRSQVPAKRVPFQLAAPSTASATDKIEAKQGLRTGTKSQVRHDLVTRKELNSRVAASAGGSGFMDLLTDQIVSAGNKEFGSLSFTPTIFTLDVTTSYTAATLEGATVWSFYPSNGSVTPGPIIRGIQAPADLYGHLRILIWHGTNSALRLAHLSTAAVSTRRIHTMSLTTADTVGTPQLITTVGPGVFVLYYDVSASQWIVIARTT